MNVRAIEAGKVAVRERQRRGVGRGQLRPLLTLSDRNWTPKLPIYAWTIDHPEGIIVVDTGETARVHERGYLPRWHPYLQLGRRVWIDAADEIGPSLCREGVDPDDVRWVVLTHLHPDHAGGLQYFPNAEVLVSDVELRTASGLAGQVRGYLPHRWPTWFTPRRVHFRAEPLGPFPDTFPLTSAGDVRLIATPGHTPGHLSVAVEDGDVLVVIAGDVSHSDDLMVDGVVDGITTDEATAQTTLDRMLALAMERPTVYLPSHDPNAARRLEDRSTVSARRA